MIMLTNSTFFSFTVGTYKLKDAATLTSVVDAALASGYRLVGRPCSIKQLHSIVIILKQTQHPCIGMKEY